MQLPQNSLQVQHAAFDRLATQVEVKVARIARFPSSLPGCCVVPLLQAKRRMQLLRPADVADRKKTFSQLQLQEGKYVLKNKLVLDGNNTEL